MNETKFPKNFLWGTAVSSYQTEGNNTNSDWWEWEQKGKTKDKSGIACDYWNRWKEDHKLLSELGVNAFRLSLEWSRIEPEEGKFSEEAINHYREILQDLKNRNIKTQVTFWWWVSPLWFQKKYGFHRKESIRIFTRYVKKITEELKDLIDIYIVINEPMLPLSQGYLTGAFPSGHKNPFRFWRSLNNLAKAYRESYKIIHQIKPNSAVGITHLYNWYETKGLGFIEKIINRIAKWFRINLFLKRIKNHQDYLGIDYYRLGRMRFDPKNSMYLGFNIEEDKNNIMGWVAYPEGIYKVLKEVYAKYKLPIYIMENGLPTSPGLEDNNRVQFIQDHIYYVRKAISEGVDVRGYNYWSLMDNFEWLYGFEPRFGLVEIDYKTLERKPRKSFYAYKEIIKK